MFYIVILGWTVTGIGLGLFLGRIMNDDGEL